MIIIRICGVNVFSSAQEIFPSGGWGYLGFGVAIQAADTAHGSARAARQRDLWRFWPQRGRGVEGPRRCQVNQLGGRTKAQCRGKAPDPSNNL